MSDVVNTIEQHVGDTSQPVVAVVDVTLTEEELARDLGRKVMRLGWAVLENHRDRARETLEVEQGGMCAVCQTREGRHLDHDHATLMVRGLLCPKCNLTEGRRHTYRDAEFAAYRASPPARGRWVFIEWMGRILPHIPRTGMALTQAYGIFVGLEIWGAKR